eukprot:8490096-Pyramimonas_sp.AAC.1
MGPETCEWCAEKKGAVVPCGRCRWRLRWTSLWGLKRVRGVSKRVRRCRAGAASGALRQGLDRKKPSTRNPNLRPQDIN